jgi:hypothetical protein
MPRIVFLLLLLLTSACNLSTQRPIVPTVETPEAAETPTSPDQPTPLPTLAPPPVLLRGGGDGCPVYLTYSGVDPNNTLSLRARPSTSAEQLLRIPNNTRVYQLRGTQEVEAEGYHWLNIFYIDAEQARHEGWVARDSFETGGARNPAIATLRLTGEQIEC